MNSNEILFNLSQFPAEQKNNLAESIISDITNIIKNSNYTSDPAIVTYNNKHKDIIYLIGEKRDIYELSAKTTKKIICACTENDLHHAMNTLQYTLSLISSIQDFVSDNIQGEELLVAKRIITSILLDLRIKANKGGI